MCVEKVYHWRNDEKFQQELTLLSRTCPSDMILADIILCSATVQGASKYI